VQAGVYDSGGISVVGGYNNSGYMNTVSEYSFTRKEWTKDVVKLSHGVHYSAAVIIDGEIHSFGGHDGSKALKEHIIITTPRVKMYQSLLSSSISILTLLYLYALLSIAYSSFSFTFSYYYSLLSLVIIILLLLLLLLLLIIAFIIITCYY